ncbi:MAG: UbiA-like polyprenyltransferase [Pseudomonadota bacterium]
MKVVGRYLFAAACLLALWKIAAAMLSPAVLPSPEAASAAFVAAVKTKVFWVHFGRSAYRVASAMILAFAVAFPLGVFIGYNRTAETLASPVVFLAYPIPKIVLLPVFLMLFGLGDAPKILMIALIAGFQILVASRDSVLGVDRKYVDSLRSMGGNHFQVIRHVIAPAALPNAFTALRIGSGTGIAVLFFVESFATNSGLGFFIMDSWGRADPEMMFVGIIGLSLLGVMLHEICNYLEKNVCAWKFLESGRQASSRPAPPLSARLLLFGRMIKFSHTVFALPFALAAAALASEDHPLSLGLFFWILTAMVGARSAAMGFNRIADARIDAENPRTADREIPAGRLSMTAAVLFVAIFSGVFVLSAAMISRLCLLLSVPVLAVLFAYSFTKRFTSFSHIYLGFAISLAPLGAWIAITGTFDARILPMSLALLTYIAGFDILYACQDAEYDRAKGLFSIPARFGARAAFHFSTVLHVLSFLSFFLIHLVFDLGPVYLGAVAVIGCLLVIEHKLVNPYDLSRIQIAFFHVNSAISIILFLGVLGDRALAWLG